MQGGPRAPDPRVRPLGQVGPLVPTHAHPVRLPQGWGWGGGHRAQHLLLSDRVPAALPAGSRPPPHQPLQPAGRARPCAAPGRRPPWHPRSSSAGTSRHRSRAVSVHAVPPGWRAASCRFPRRPSMPLKICSLAAPAQTQHPGSLAPLQLWPAGGGGARGALLRRGAGAACQAASVCGAGVPAQRDVTRMARPAPRSCLCSGQTRAPAARRYRTGSVPQHFWRCSNGGAEGIPST